MRLNTSLANSPKNAFSSTSSPADRVPSAGLVSTADLQTHCASIVGSSVRSQILPNRTELGSVRRASEQLALGGVTLDEAQRAVHTAVSAGLRHQVDHDGLRSADGAVVDRAVFMMSVLELLGNIVSAAYLDHCRQESGNVRERVGRLVDLLSAGDPRAYVVAERIDIDIAPEYDVVVVQFLGELSARNRTAIRCIDSDVMSDVEAALNIGSVGSRPLMSLDGLGGIILVPCGDTDEVDVCVERLKSVIGVDMVAATARATAGEMATVTAHCRELAGLARGLGMMPKLYRIGDLALEYQISRPGPGGSRLRAVIAPLDTFPELLHTLRTFIATEANRRASAKQLYVHPNTVDYRLKRIEHLCGIDPLSSAGLMSLHAALVVDSLARVSGSSSVVSRSTAAAS